ncbi:MFS general substrate transporter [Aspergillus ellipticus CBS 707.79]|uniref:MFS general substrate transporter n=1 Tax=Aspergillus ellipticus CBS 707.79 TaxID=1448320 RepID=A0A319D1C2_9EURO|nr:MFS general substrate transporter [Aspergillus ellipticus CBS 707.79]
MTLLKPVKQGDALLVDAAGDIQRLPLPSQDPNDPLNFTVWEKTGVMVSCCWFSIMSLSIVGGLGAILTTFFEIYGAEGISNSQVVWLSTFPSLFVGIGNYLVLPLGLVYGRRPAALVSIAVLFAATIGCAVSQNFHQHLGLRILQGLATGATESLLPLMLSEITFVHQRGLIFGVYWATQNVVTSCLNLATSYETAALGWRWFYWVYVIAVGAGLVIVVFGCFETRYQRRAQFLNGQVVVTDQFGVTQVLSGPQAEEYRRELEADDGSTPDEAREKHTYWQMLQPWGTPVKNTWTTVLMAWFHMFEAFTSPGILYATLLASAVLGSSVGVSLTYDTVLQSYGWPARSVGLINLGGVFGGFGGMLYAGVFGIWFILRMAKRSGGVHTPEHRLVLLIFPGILTVASLLLYGFTASGGSTWGGPYMGWTILQVAFVSVLIQSTSFAAEAWEKNPGPALAAVVGTKNIVSFGVSYGLSPMVARYSYPTAMGILAGICGAIFLLGIPVYSFNPAWRRYRQRRESKKAML